MELGREMATASSCCESASSIRVQTVLLAGRWSALVDVNAAHPWSGVDLVRCPPKVRDLQDFVRRHRPTWLVLGEGLDEDVAIELSHAGRAAAAGLRLAVLGPALDLERCELWMRRRCLVYLSVETSVERAANVLRMAQEHCVVAIDRCFQELAQQQGTVADRLTKREREILRLLRSGLRNSEIARDLFVSKSTVEFHVRNLLEKLGARNRVEAVERSKGFGL